MFVVRDIFPILFNQSAKFFHKQIHFPNMLGWRGLAVTIRVFSFPQSESLMIRSNHITPRSAQSTDRWGERASVAVHRLERDGSRKHGEVIAFNHLEWTLLLPWQRSVAMALPQQQSKSSRGEKNVLAPSYRCRRLHLCHHPFSRLHQYLVQACILLQPRQSHRFRSKTTLQV